jgi:hypothetical protein
MPSMFRKTDSAHLEPVLAGIILWVIIEEIAALALYSVFGIGWTTSTLKILIGAAIGIPLVSYLVKQHGTVDYFSPSDRIRSERLKGPP